MKRKHNNIINTNIINKWFKPKIINKNNVSNLINFNFSEFLKQEKGELYPEEVYR